MNTGFLVLGSPRSGTSATAGVLSYLGIDFGDADDLLPASDMNPKGFFQSQEFEQLFDGTEFIPDPYLPYVGTMTTADRSFRLRRLLRQRRSGGDWGVKCARMPWVLSEVVAYCRDGVKILRTRRAAESSAASWRQWINDGDAAGLVKRANLAIDRALSLVPWIPVLEVPYAALIADPRGTVSEIAAFADRPVSEDAVAFVEPALNHYDG